MRIEEAADLKTVRASLGIPASLAACHTAEVAGYILEGGRSRRSRSASTDRSNRSDAAAGSPEASFSWFAGAGPGSPADSARRAPSTCVGGNSGPRSNAHGSDAYETNDAGDA